MKGFSKRFSVALASTSLLALSSTAVLAQDAQDSSEDNDENKTAVEEVVVTGTYLQGKSQFTSASPMASIGAEKLSDIGAANFADLVQTLTINNGAQNNPDAFTQNGTVGTSNFNLRGLGVSSTLVLLNGRRQVLTGAITNDGVNFVDTSSLIPQIATKRIEIVKDGAAALYGTDAVAGVVNFITDDEFEGFSARARYGGITDQGTQTDFLVEGKAGFAGDNWNIMAAFSYYDRTELTTAERRLSRAVDDTSSLGNPGAFFLFGALPVIDPTGCTEVGGFERPLGGSAQATVDAVGLPFTAGFCGFDFGDYFSLVPEEERIQGYTTASIDFGEGHEFRTEFAFANNSALRGNSPTFPFLQLGSAVVPADHPNNIFPAALGPVLFFGRAIGNGGSVSPSTADNDTYRYNASLTGPITDSWNYDVAFTYAENTFVTDTEDTVTERFSNALRGLGGPNCDVATGSPGQGSCLYYNPFATSFTTAPNDPGLLDYLIDNQIQRNESELAVIDAVVSGTIGETPAGEIGLAVGFQYRDESYNREFDSISQNDGFAFIIGDRDFASDRNIVAFFAETLIPLADGLELQAAARFEDYGGSIGNTIDPKVALLWQATDELTFRSSFSTSFRAPSVFQQFGAATTLNQVFDPVSGGQFFAAVRALRPGEDGRSITPEESNALNIGFTYQGDSSLTFSVDFWRYDFSEVIIQENFQSIINADPNSDRVVRANPADPASPILFVFTDYVNASSVTTTGLDFSLNYAFEAELGTISPFVEGTYILSYDIDDPQAGEVDGVNQRNFTNFGNPTPQLRFNAGLAFSNELNSIRAFMRFIDNYNDDQVRAGEQTPGVRNIPTHITVDIQYSLNLGFMADALDETSLNIGLINAFDNTPPRVFTNGGFDSRTHDPRGRYAYVELSTTF